MLKSIKILRRQSELKSTIREFDGRDDLTDAEKAKLTAAQVELAQSETDLREAFDAEEAEREANARQNPGISSEVREYVNLARAASVTQFMAIGADTLALSDASGETRELLRTLAEQDGREIARADYIQCEGLLKLSPPRRANLLRERLAALGIAAPSEARLNAALDMLLNAAADRRPEARWGGVRLTRRRGRIFICRDDLSESD